MSSDLVFYGNLLAEIKNRIRQGQTRAALSANAEMIAMYWDIGRMIAARQTEEGGGAGVIPRLAADLKNGLPEHKGVSQRNLKYMIRFAREYGDPQSLAPVPAKVLQPAAQLENTDGDELTNLPQCGKFGLASQDSLWASLVPSCRPERKGQGSADTLLVCLPSPRTRLDP